MTPLDYLVTAAAVLLLLAVGFWTTRRGSRSTGSYILGGRRLPWWLGGTAMVADNSNTDSALHQSGKIRREGLAGAWFYWSQLFSYVFHALVFSRLWRRTGVTTPIEFYELRYGGRAAKWGRVWAMVFAAYLRGIMGLALGLLSMVKICPILLGVREPITLLGYTMSPELFIVLAGTVLGLSYSTAAGLLGVVAGDVMEFLTGIICSYILMFFVYRGVGYADGLREGLAQLDLERMLSFAPAGGIALLVFLSVQPFANLAGDINLNQRFLALRSERDAMFSGIWRLVNHYFIRSWPWYITGLASVLLLAGTQVGPEQAYPQLIVSYLPSGLRGLMFASMLVAFMSSVGSVMHSCGSVFVNDFYRPYVVTAATDRHYVWMIRLTMVVTGIVGTLVALAFDQLLTLLQVGMTAFSVGGAVATLRWFWWRVNGWADFAAQVVSLPVALFFTLGPGKDWIQRFLQDQGNFSSDNSYAVSYLLSFGITTALWLAVMWATPPESEAKLADFYRKVRPYGFWGPVAARCPDVVVTDRFSVDLLRYLVGLLLALGFLFGMGLLLLGRPVLGAISVAAGIGAAWWLIRSIAREYPESAEEQTTASETD